MVTGTFPPGSFHLCVPLRFFPPGTFPPQCFSPPEVYPLGYVRLGGETSGGVKT